MRKKSLLHRQLEIQSIRSGLTNDEGKELQKLARGYSGEVAFDEVLRDYVVDSNLIHIKDYLFEYDGGKSEVQIDNIIIANDVIFIFEVKNYNANLCYTSSDMFSFESGQDCGDLNVQLERQRTGIRQLFKEMTPRLDVSDYDVFINPEQTIYGLSNRTRVLVQSNLRRVLKRLLLPNHYSHDGLLKFLEKNRLVRSRYERQFPLNIDAMRKGVFCSECLSEMRRLSNYYYRCECCDVRYSTLEVIQMLIDELKCLDYGFRITSADLSKLSGHQICATTIRRHRRRGKVQF